MNQPIRRLLKSTVLILAFAYSLPAHNAKSATNSEQFMNALGTCAASMQLEISADVLGSIKEIYEGKKGVEGHVSLKNAPDFLILFPESERGKAYEIYVKCITEIIGKVYNQSKTKKIAQKCTSSLIKCKREFKSDRNSSIDSCQAYLECDPNNPGVFSLLGQSYRSIGLMGKSDHFFKKQLEFSNKFEDEYVRAAAYHNLALNSLIRGAPDNALKLVKKSEIINKNTNLSGLAANYKLFGDIYYRKSRFDAAIGYFNRSIQICTDIEHKKCLSSAYTGYGFSKLKLKNRNEGCKYINKAHELNSEMGDYKRIKKSKKYIEITKCY